MRIGVIMKRFLKIVLILLITTSILLFARKTFTIQHRDVKDIVVKNSYLVPSKLSKLDSIDVIIAKKDAMNKAQDDLEMSFICVTSLCLMVAIILIKQNTNN